jgi:hypothetical protein
MARTNTLSSSHSPTLNSDASVNTRDAKDEANGSAPSERSLGTDKPVAEEMRRPKKIHIGWSLLAFALFCGVAWGVIFLVLRLVL